MTKSSLIFFFFHRYINYTGILVILFTVLTACSNTKFIYTFAQKFIRDEISYFVDLNKEEEVFLNQQVSKMITWHQKSMLPSYAAYMIDIADKLELDKYSSADIAVMIAYGRSLIEETVIGLTPYASQFLIRHQTVDDIQFIKQRMVKRYQKRLEEISKPPEVRYEDRLNRLMSNFERFFGELSDTQIILLETYALATLDDSKVRLYNRKMRQKVFIKFLSTQPTQEELMNYLNKLLLNGHEIINPTYHDFSEASLKRFQELLASILLISSEKQQESIIVNLRRYADDFIAVSR
ncbi:MAG: DUF6279 family lipoprotein [Alphaproteobacteria bacterium]